jgi:hypothetical protein
MYTFVTSAGSILFGFAFMVFCFMITRRTGALYRMFFAGLPLFGFIMLPFNMIMQLNSGMLAGIAAINIFFALVQLLAVVFVLIHAAKHRHEDFAPPILTPPPYDNPAASAAA